MTDAASGAIKSGYRWELDRAIRTNNYLRVFFSTAVLGYCAFGPGLLIRFPTAVSGVRLGTVTQFYAFRPVIFSLVFVAFCCVLAALARRAHFLFEEAFYEDVEDDTPADKQKQYITTLRPSPLPFVLSGNLLVDAAIFFVTLVAYSFWVILLVETIPEVMGTHQVIGIVLGSYGLFGGLIIVAAIWAGLARRARRLLREHASDPA
jgi:hypothetical protein